MSTITGWPHFSVSFCAIVRAPTSLGPPAAKPTRIRIGFVGYCCASAQDAPAVSSAKTYLKNARG